MESMCNALEIKVTVGTAETAQVNEPVVVTVLAEEQVAAIWTPEAYESLPTLTGSGSFKVGSGTIKVDLLEGEGTIRAIWMRKDYLILDVSEVSCDVVFSTSRLPRSLTLNYLLSNSGGDEFCYVVYENDKVAHVGTHVAAVYERSVYRADSHECLLLELNGRYFAMSDCTGPESLLDLLAAVECGDEERICYWAEEMKQEDFQEIVRLESLQPATINGFSGKVCWPVEIEEVGPFLRHALGINPWDYPIFIDRANLPWDFACWEFRNTVAPEPSLIHRLRGTRSDEASSESTIGELCSKEVARILHHRHHISRLEAISEDDAELRKELEELSEDLVPVEDELDGFLVDDVIRPLSADLAAALGSLRRLRAEDADWFTAFHRDNLDLLIKPLNDLRQEIESMERMLSI